MKYAIALTGGIGSGKSTACSFLKLYGYHVICADEIAHEILEDSKNEVLEVFGSEILEDCKINRKKLGLIVFNDKDKKIQLEKILHPKIKLKITKEAEILDENKIPYFIDIPLFFETKNYEILETLLIYVPQDLQIQRVMKRNNFTYNEAIMRIKAQMDIEKKKKLATYVIDNSGDLESLQKEIEKYLYEYLEKREFLEKN